MRTCPACGKENEDSVTRCATCDEEIGAGSVVLASEAEAEGEPVVTTMKVDAQEVFAAAAAGAAEQVKDSVATVPREEAGSNHTVAVEDPPEKPAGEQDSGKLGAPVVPADRAGISGGDTQRSGARISCQIPAELKQVAIGSNALAFQPGTVKLVVEQGMSVNKEYLLNDPELIIGRRDPEQEFMPDIDLFDQENANNRYISRRQARLFFQEGHLFVEDLDSSNGTCVNNRPIKPNMSVQLNPGDKLLLGQSVMFRIRPMAT